MDIQGLLLSPNLILSSCSTFLRRLQVLFWGTEDENPSVEIESVVIIPKEQMYTNHPNKDKVVTHLFV